MKPRLLLVLLIQGGKRSGSGGFSMAATLLVALALTLGTLALASYFSGALLSSRDQGVRNDAAATAEAGMNRLMSTFNQPVNRRFLVSGLPMSNWASASDTDLLSPCRDTANQPPGNPTTQARNFGDGKFRALDTLEVNKGSRQFRVTKVTYSAGLADQADRRSQSITTTAGSGTLTKVGNFSSDLINLNDPVDLNKFPGYNNGYITVTVEAKVVQGGKVSTATLTREYEVLPRCCGASFGSNASGGSSLMNNSASLGSDSRFCGVEFGMIVGLNGGTAWQNLANDRFTKRLPSGAVVPIGNIIGIVSQDGDQFSRATSRMRPNSASTTVPDPCDPTRWTGGSCSGSSWGGLKSAKPGGTYGTQADIDGTAMSGIPIMPSALTLPTVGSESVAGKYNFTWTVNEGSWARVTSSSTGGNSRYPVLNPPGASGYKYRFRTRTTAVTGLAAPPVVEVCNESPLALGGTNGCSSAGNWSSISRGIAPVDSIETFTTASGAAWGGTAWGNSIASGPWIDGGISDWFEIDRNTVTQNTSADRVRVVNGELQIGAGGSMTALQNGLCRAVNLSGNLGRGMLSFDQRGSGVSAGDELWVQVTTSGSATTACNSPSATGSNITSQWITIAKFPGVTADTRRVVSLADYQANPMRIRIINGTATSGTRTHIIDDINASLSDWCQYAAVSPASAAPGFHCLGPQFNLTVDDSVWTSNPVGGQVYIDASGGPTSFYYTRTDDLRGNSYSYVNPTTGANPVVAVDNGGFIRLVKCAGSPSTNCTAPVSETDVALVGDPDNLNFFGRDTGTQQVVYFGVVNTSSGTGRISGVWFYMPVGYFELKAYNCAGYDPPGTAPNINLDDGWILNGRIWTQHFKPCGDIHIRVPPSSASNLGAVAAASQLLSESITYVPWTGTDWVARAVTQSRTY
ncbi:hypothetical protein [Vulcanococcus limneticus]|uniref:hypothetical protein n=1 Tax=Vulcanococcus limneticus TaxID=2170428 RepID=UPI00398BEB55